MVDRNDSVVDFLKLTTLPYGGGYPVLRCIKGLWKKIAIVPIILLFFFVLNLVKYIFSLYFCENVL